MVVPEPSVLQRALAMVMIEIIQNPLKAFFLLLLVVLIITFTIIAFALCDMV